jgi:hypothetical protein
MFINTTPIIAISVIAAVLNWVFLYREMSEET